MRLMLGYLARRFFDVCALVLRVKATIENGDGMLKDIRALMTAPPWLPVASVIRSVFDIVPDFLWWLISGYFASALMVGSVARMKQVILD
jgi:hypothetical protein